jgi:hypothetical protein
MVQPQKSSCVADVHQRKDPSSQWGTGGAGSPGESEPQVEDDGEVLKDVAVEPCVILGSRIETGGVEAFHGPADMDRTKFVMGNASHEPKSGTPAIESFVSGVLDGFTVGGPVNKEPYALDIT